MQSNRTHNRSGRAGRQTGIVHLVAGRFQAATFAQRSAAFAARGSSGDAAASGAAMTAATEVRKAA